ncbi:DUF4342 domain-containing protein [Anaerolineae bacterium CFX9]|nr:DUF4342 domain-containing protein [Anaerolineae bacterium CFX9]
MIQPHCANRRVMPAPFDGVPKNFRILIIIAAEKNKRKLKPPHYATFFVRRRTMYSEGILTGVYRIMTNQDNNPNRKTMTEELEVMGNQLVDRVKELIEQGNVRRLIIRDQNSRTLLEIPLTVGVVAGGALAVFWPLLAGLAVVGGIVARLKIEVVRENPDVIEETKKKVEEIADEE